MKHGFIRVASATPLVHLANAAANVLEMERQMAIAEGKGVEILCFPELSVTGYSCQDLFAQQVLIDEAEHALLRLVEISRTLHLTTIVGLPFVHRGLLFNCAAVLQDGKIVGMVPKTYIPNYKEFYEQRWFASSSLLPKEDTVKCCGQSVPFGADLLFELNGTKWGIEICEDLWAPIAPSSRLAIAGAEIIFNLSASNELVGKQHYMRQLIATQSATTHCAYVYSGSGFGESTQDLVFGGRAFIFENGDLLAENARFQQRTDLLYADIDIDALCAERRSNSSFAKSLETEQKDRNYRTLQLEWKENEQQDFVLAREISPLPFVPTTDKSEEHFLEALNIQSQGLASRLRHIAGKSVVIGISGGLDSTLALLVAVHAFDTLGLSRKGIVGVTMPGFGTSDRTYQNALRLMELLGISQREISISEAVMLHFNDIGHDAAVHDTTYENAQARERTQILMDLGNQLNAIVVGTGDLSELALGWATYNGDHMSMYAVNASMPKTLIRRMVAWLAESFSEEEIRQTLLDIVATPISPELKPTDGNGEIAQKTEDLVGPYELHDFFLYYTLRYGYRPRKIFTLAQFAFDGHKMNLYYSADDIVHWMTVFFRRFFSQQFKRSCMPDGPKVCDVSLSPRGDWRMPSDALSATWLKECETLLPKHDAPAENDEA